MRRSLDQLQLGETATITDLTAAGADRRRLLDLGILPGTAITAELRSPLGEPVAYRVRGALIALRRNQARAIWIADDISEPSS